MHCMKGGGATALAGFFHNLFDCGRWWAGKTGLVSLSQRQRRRSLTNAARGVCSFLVRELNSSVTIVDAIIETDRYVHRSSHVETPCLRSKTRSREQPHARRNKPQKPAAPSSGMMEPSRLGHTKRGHCCLYLPAERNRSGFACRDAAGGLTGLSRCRCRP